MYPIESMKEKMNHQNDFLQKTEILWQVNENARNNHKAKLGENFLDSYKEKFSSIRAERKLQSFKYQNKLITTPIKELLERQKVVKIRQRILRSNTEVIFNIFIKISYIHFENSKSYLD